MPTTGRMEDNRGMSVSAAQADAFYREVVEHSTVWGVRDGDGFPAPETPAGRAMPFWSLRSRAESIVARVPAYAGFEVVGLPLDEWRSRWLPGLQRDGVRVGLNWTGERATGFDLLAEDVETNLAARGTT
jgi:hypothetical protein